MARFIFITGGVVSSLGKGLSSAALGALLQARGFRVRLRKLDPYLNVDPGTMSPYQHGEVFVTDDGAETDLDLGHYERFTGVDARQTDNITTGRIYSSGDRPRAPRRISRRHRAGDPARHRRHQGIRPRRHRRRGLRPGRDRRHGRRHRKPAVPRSDPPARQRARPRAHDVRASDPAAVDADGRRAQDQADPAFGQGAAERRNPARPAGLPLGDKEIPANERRKIALFCNVQAGAGDPGARRRHDLPGADRLSRPGLRPRGLQVFRPRRQAEPNLDRWRGVVRVGARARGQGHDRRGRQVHGAARRLQVARPRR